MGSFFAGIWNTIQAQFTNIGQKVGDAIGGAFKSAMNSALSTVENAVNKAIGFINGAIDVINTRAFFTSCHLCPNQAPIAANTFFTLV